MRICTIALLVAMAAGFNFTVEAKSKPQTRYQGQKYKPYKYKGSKHKAPKYKTPKYKRTNY